MAITFTDCGNQQDTGTNQTSVTFTNFSTAAADRVMVIEVAVNDAAATYSATSATIGGVNAAIFQTPAGINSKALLLVAHVPSDAGGFGVVINWSEAITSDQVLTAIAYYGANGDVAAILSAHQLLIDDSTNDTVISGTIDCPAGGVVTGAASMAGAVSISAWSLGTVDNHQLSTDAAVRMGGAHEVFATAQSGLTVSATASANTTVKSLAAVAIGPGSSGSVSPPALNIGTAAVAPSVAGASSGAVAPPPINIATAAVAPVIEIITPTPPNQLTGPLGAQAMGVEAMGGSSSPASSGAVTVPVLNIGVAAVAPAVVGNMSGVVAPPAVNIGMAPVAPAVDGVAVSAGTVAPPALDIGVAALAPTVSVGTAGTVQPPAVNIGTAALAPAVVGNMSGLVEPPAISIGVAPSAPVIVGNMSGLVLPPVLDIGMAALAPDALGFRDGLVEPPCLYIGVGLPVSAILINGWDMVEPPGAWDVLAQQQVVWLTQTDSGSWSTQED